MKTRFVVLQAKGPSWDPTRLRRAQAQWDEHAVFMDQLTADGFVILGGPLGEGDGEDALLVVDPPMKMQLLRPSKTIRGSKRGFWRSSRFSAGPSFWKQKKSKPPIAIAPAHGLIFTFASNPTDESLLSFVRRADSIGLNTRMDFFCAIISS